jgi:hypothetical protein
MSIEEAEKKRNDFFSEQFEACGETPQCVS